MRQFIINFNASVENAYIEAESFIAKEGLVIFVLKDGTEYRTVYSLYAIRSITFRDT
jgi:hypothetical protein